MIEFLLLAVVLIYVAISYQPARKLKTDRRQRVDQVDDCSTSASSGNLAIIDSPGIAFGRSPSS
jgi:hypothetical protein